MHVVVLGATGNVGTALLRALDATPEVRSVLGVAPLVIGAGTQAVNCLGVQHVADGIRLVNRSIVPVGDDVLLAWDVKAPHPTVN